MPPPKRSLAWGILGTGRIARKLAAGINESVSGHLAAVGSRRIESARAFAQEFGVPRALGSYEEVLANDEVQAVYISLPNHLHAGWTIRCATAGKHVLCEKPLTVNRAEAERVIETVRHAGVFLMEAFLYRCHPQTLRLAEIVRGGRPRSDAMRRVGGPGPGRPPRPPRAVPTLPSSEPPRPPRIRRGARRTRWPAPVRIVRVAPAPPPPRGAARPAATQTPLVGSPP